jgi:hypothetical protein
MGSGARALMLNIRARSKDNGEGNTTLEQVIRAWAPASDNNNEESYLGFVVEQTQLSPAHIVDPADANAMARIARAIAIKECGWGDCRRYAPELLDGIFWQTAWTAAFRGA